MGLKLYNSLTRKKEEFKPLKKDKVGIYVCGPTVYSHAHLGHAKSYISFDVLVRYLRYLGYSVTYVQNITDVGHLTDDADEGEDKIVKAAAKEKKHPMALAEFYTRSYFEDMDALNCVRPDISPRASGHIVEQIELVKKLLEKGCAYEVNGSVYFDISKFKDYGKLSGRNINQMQAGARVEVSPDKKHPADFALWKKAEPNHIMQWPSPWGMGFPGWHLECSVMSTKYLGQPFDIHGGGIENQFPHHECEIAQAEAAEGKQFVKYWVHNNMVTVDGQKMGKSLNNFITLKQAFSGAHERLSRKYDPLAVRQLILNSHYRSPIDFSDAALFAAQSGYEKVVNAATELSEQRLLVAPDGELDEKVINSLNQLKNKFEDAMNDDLNTAVGLSVIFDLVQLTNVLLENKNASKGTFNAVYELFTKLGGEVLGIVEERYVISHLVSDLTKRVKDTEYKVKNLEDKTVDSLFKLIDNINQERKKRRQSKDFETADMLRNILQQSGITVSDEKMEQTDGRMK
jgi:cysteinyl-tRNA synthetase